MDNVLHKIRGRARKCGPAAIAAITGIKTHEAAGVAARGERLAANQQNRPVMCDKGVGKIAI